MHRNFKLRESRPWLLPAVIARWHCCASDGEGDEEESMWNSYGSSGLGPMVPVSLPALIPVSIVRSSSNSDPNPDCRDRRGGNSETRTDG
jgi:hypothetical protein